MLFNSLEFLLFFPVVMILYQLLPRKHRWLLLLASSYLFYMAWKVEYVFLILFSTGVDYWAALRMVRTEEPRVRRRYLFLSIFANLGLLFAFKYMGFFNTSLNEAFAWAGLPWQFFVPNWLLPVGISFYTFQTMSYTIDVYKGKVKPERHFGYFALYVSFFPQLVAGPIERPGHLLPQLHRLASPTEKEFASGIRLMLWGYFKKVVIADRIVMFTQPVFMDPENFGFWSVVPALFFLLIQVYADFSGYTDIAIGSARCMGVHLSENFNRPFTATSIRDFWARWHITLTNWFRDYLFFSFSFTRKGKVQRWRIHLGLFLMLLLIGLWHGANWTFITFGAIHGVYLIVGNLIRPYGERMALRTGLSRRPLLREYLGIARTMLLLMFSAFFFGRHSFAQSMTMMRQAVVMDGFKGSLLWLRGNDSILSVLLVIFLFVAERKMAHQGGGAEILSRLSVGKRWLLYLAFFFFILIFGIFHKNEFIYFQF